MKNIAAILLVCFLIAGCGSYTVVSDDSPPVRVHYYDNFYYSWYGYWWPYWYSYGYPRYYNPYYFGPRVVVPKAPLYRPAPRHEYRHLPPPPKHQPPPKQDQKKRDTGSTRSPRR